MKKCQTTPESMRLTLDEKSLRRSRSAGACLLRLERSNTQLHTKRSGSESCVAGAGVGVDRFLIEGCWFCGVSWNEFELGFAADTRHRERVVVIAGAVACLSSNRWFRQKTQAR